MNVSELEQLVLLVQGANIHELTLRHNGARVTIRKAPNGSEPAENTTPGGDEVEAGDASANGNGAGGELPETDGTVSVTSPLVGTFRTAKLPVELGALVKAGQVIGIIEAMKLPNDVTATCAGKVVEVFVEAGQFVEYGQPLFALEPEN